MRLSYKSVFGVLFALVVLVVAGLLFFGRQDEVALAVPVTLERVPPDLITLSDTPLLLEARLKGRSRILKDIMESEISCKIDLSKAKPGPLFVKISPEMISVPKRVSVLAVDPASFSITVDRRMEKILPIVPDLNEDPAPGYVIPSVVTIPCMAQLTGPMSVLEEMSAVRTTPIDVGKLTETVKKKVALNLNHNPHVKTIGDSLVEVEIVVEQKMVEKWLDMAVQAKGSEYRYVITPDRIEILLKGPVQTLEKLSQDNGVEVYVDLKGLTPGTYVRRAVIKPPLNITLVEAKPEVFTVKVHKSKRTG